MKRNETSKGNRYFKTKKALAAALGVSAVTIRNWVNDGKLIPTATGRWSYNRGLEILAEPSKRAEKKKKAASEKERAQIRKINEETKLVKLRIAAARGEVVGRDEMEEAHQLFANFFRERMLAIPDRCRLRIGDAAAAVVEDEIRHALETLPEELARAVPDKPPAALIEMVDDEGEE